MPKEQSEETKDDILSSSDELDIEDINMNRNEVGFMAIPEEEFQTVVAKMKNGKVKIPLSKKKRLENVFSGRVLIKWLIKHSNALATNKSEALLLYEQLIQNSIIVNAKYPMQTAFKSTNYYRFIEEADLLEEEEEEEEEEKTTDENQESEDHNCSICSRKIIQICRKKKSEFDKLIEDFTNDMKNQLLILNYFTGTEAANWMLKYLNTNENWKKVNGNWREFDALSVLQYITDMGYLKKKSKNISEFIADDTKYDIENDRTTYAINMLKERSHSKSIGRAMKKDGAKPKFPVIIIPGLASSALEIWESERQPSWVGDRIWIDVAKIAHSAHFLKIKNIPKIKKEKIASDSVESSSSSKKNRGSSSSSSSNVSSTSSTSLKKKGKKRSGSVNSRSTEEEEQTSMNIDAVDEEIETSEFLYHLLPGNDGFSDPKGVKIRAAESFSAVDYLSHAALSKKASYVFAYVFKELKSVGYDNKNMTVAPYDWRIPLSALQSRDGYFTILKSKIEVLFEINNNTRVVPICHSMGNRVFGYFLQWVEIRQPGWADKYIESWMALGAPFLGAPKVIRGLITGDCLGLDFFLLVKEGLKIGRSMGSLPCLLPHYHQRLPYPIINLAFSTQSSQIVDLTNERMRSYQSSWIQFQSLDPDHQFNSLTRASCQWIKQYDDNFYPLLENDYETLTPTNIGGIWKICGNMSQYFKDIIDFIPTNIHSIAKTSLFNPYSMQINLKPCDHDKINCKILSNGQSIGINETFHLFRLRTIENMLFGEGEQNAYFLHSKKLCCFGRYKEGLEVGFIFQIIKNDVISNAEKYPHHYSASTLKYLNDLREFPSDDGTYLISKLIIKSPYHDQPMIVTLTYAKTVKLSCSYFVNNKQTEEDKIWMGWWNSFQSNLSFYSDQALSTYAFKPSDDHIKSATKSHSNLLKKSKIFTTPTHTTTPSNNNNNSNTTSSDSKPHHHHHHHHSNNDPSLNEKKVSNFYEIYEKEDYREYPDFLARERLQFHPTLFRGSFQLDPSRSEKFKKIFKYVKRGFVSKLVLNLRKLSDNMIEEIKPHSNGFKVVTICNGVKMFSFDCILHSFYSNYSKVMGYSDILSFFSRDLYKQITVFVYDHGTMVKVRQITNDLIFARTIYRPNNSESSVAVDRIFVRITPISPNLTPLIVENKNVNSNDNTQNDDHQTDDPQTDDHYIPPLYLVDHDNEESSSSVFSSLSSFSTSSSSQSTSQLTTSHSTSLPSLPSKKHQSRRDDATEDEDDESNNEGGCTEYGNPNAFLTLKSQTPFTWNLFESFYLNDPLYLNHNVASGHNDVDLLLHSSTPPLRSDDDDNNNNDNYKTQLCSSVEETKQTSEIFESPILNIPNVRKLWCIYGVGIETEVSYYFRENAKENCLILDSSADKRFSTNECKVSGGIVYETSNTPQPVLQYKPKSGDGTVPYCSLAFPLHWQEIAKTKNVYCPEIDMIEVEKAEHRSMLAEESVLYHILHYVCHGKASPFATLNK